MPQDNRKKSNRYTVPAVEQAARLLSCLAETDATHKGFSAVTAPVLGVNEIPIGHISIIGLLSANTARQLGPHVAEAGKMLSRQLGAYV